ncbi:MAG: hypothetical protein CMP48_27875, partial [Rickettsiales bacterium]|nr:hypothetical protein [Rickettsiales bacterium]
VPLNLLLILFPLVLILIFNPRNIAIKSSPARIVIYAIFLLSPFLNQYLPEKNPVEPKALSIKMSTKFLRPSASVRR